MLPSDSEQPSLQQPRLAAAFATPTSKVSTARREVINPKPRARQKNHRVDSPARSMSRRMDHCGEIASFIHVCTHDSRLSLRDLVLCFQTCRAWQYELKSMGFSFGAAWLCAALGRGKDPRNLACRITEMHERVSGRRLDVADQIVRFLLRHQEGKKNQIIGADRRTIRGEERERRWAQLASQEPSDSYLSQAVRAMQWFWKDQFIQQRFGKVPGYHCCVSAMPKNHDRISNTCVSPDGKMFAYSCPTSPQSDAKNLTIEVCEMSTGLEVRNMQIPSDYIYDMALSPNNKLLAICLYCKVRHSTTRVTQCARR
jgi:hypothetical protein